MATTAYLIPLQAANQILQISLAGVIYQLRVRWNSPNQAWTLDIASASGAPIISGIPIVTGQNLLAPYAYLNLGGQLIAQTTNDTAAVPTLANLGSTGNLFFTTVAS